MCQGMKKTAVKWNKSALVGGSMIFCVIVLGFIALAIYRKHNATLISRSPLIFPENPAEENLADMLQASSSGVMVKIFTGEVSGSGVIYMADGEELVIVTAGHVLEQAETSVWVSFLDDWAVECTEYRIARDADAAFIRVPLSEIPEEYQAHYFTANMDKESFDSLKSGDGVIVMGSQSGVAGNAYEGSIMEPWLYLEDFSQYMLTVKGEASQGMSGGGVFDQNGHFIGLLCGGSEDGELAVLPLSVIMAKYQEIF